MKKLLVILILIPSILFCQDISDLQNKKLNDLNDMELSNYWKEAQELCLQYTKDCMHQ